MEIMAIPKLTATHRVKMRDFGAMVIAHIGQGIDENDIYSDWPLSFK